MRTFHPQGRTGVRLRPVRRRRALPLLAAFPGILGGLAFLSGDQGVLLNTFQIHREEGVELRLSRALEEVSGLAVTPDGRLFAHNDERAVFYELDPESGETVSAFSAGAGGVGGDFEGIAIAGERFFLMTSGGEILETTEGRPGSAMSYRVHQTGLGARCELEGLAFDPGAGTLLLPCKEPRRKELEDHIVVYSISVASMRPEPVPRIFLALKDLEGFGMKDAFSPAGIEIHPGTGNILLVSARQEAILELSSLGTLLDAQDLRRRIHPQTEGITFASDGSLLLADEGQGRRGRLTRYPPDPDSGSGPS